MASAKRMKAALITGCTPGGIGYALARAFHKNGFLVIATARRPEVIESLRSDGVIGLALDVTKSESIKSCHEKVVEITGGKLDILINNAGLSHTIPAIDVDMDDVRNTFETNFFAVMAMVKAFSRLLIAARGRIINISSLASITPYVYASVFCAAKGALNSYSRTLRQELRPFGVKVTVVMAGFVKTKTNKIYRELPDDSLYSVVKDQFQKKLTYAEDTSHMTADTFANILVARILREETPWGSFFGTSDWLWIGGSAGLVRAATWIGEWFIDALVYRKFNLHRLERIVNSADKQL